MASTPWIESHTLLIRHKKLILMAKELRLKPVYLMGHLHALWHTAMEQQEDGDLSSWSDELIAEFSQFQGDVLQYVRLLRKYGWLDGNLIHDWMDYAGRYLENKYRTSNPDRLKAIKQKHAKVKLSSDSSQTLDGLKSDFSPSKVGQPNLTLPNHTKPEKTIGKTPFADFEKSAIAQWNSFCDDYPILSKVSRLSDERRKRLKKRFEQNGFRKFQEILTAIKEQPFLLGEKGWKVNFDWLIKNDTNYLRVLERYYSNNNQEDSLDEYRKSIGLDTKR